MVQDISPKEYSVKVILLICYRYAHLIIRHSWDRYFKKARAHFFFVLCFLSFLIVFVVIDRFSSLGKHS